jgi:PKD repeat protein
MKGENVMKKTNTKIFIEGLMVLCLVLGYAVPIQAQEPDPVTVTLTLVDEAGNPLANYPVDYPSETRNLKYKYRCGGSWIPSTDGTPFQTNASGQLIVSIGCENWDNKVTLILNQTSKEQEVTDGLVVFQAAKVNANLITCTDFITDVPGGTVAQGGGYWYTHGTTGPTGTVSFYTFPGNIKLRMGYSHITQTLFPTIVAGTNEVDFQTTALTINYTGEIKSNTGGSWWYFSKPKMNLLPGDYNFYFDGVGPVPISVSGCSMVYPEPTNHPPVADPSGPYLGAVGESILFDGTGSYDPDGDDLTYAWDFGDGNTGTGEAPNHSYASAGIYDVCLIVNNGTEDSEPVCTIAVVYDPSAGFVTGGGWIYSEPGNYRPDTSLEGKASFGFVAKYKKGASVPDGNTEFQFKAGDLNFHSSSYEWLVVSGSNKAKFKGTGTINGEGPYKFMIWAGDKAWDGVDSFRIKIWTEGNDDNPVYDNGEEDGPGTQISGGNIVVHTN